MTDAWGPVYHRLPYQAMIKVWVFIKSRPPAELTTSKHYLAGSNRPNSKKSEEQP